MAGRHGHLDAVRRDAALWGFVLAYLVVSAGILAAAGVPEKFQPLRYASMVLPGFWIPFLLLAAGWAVWRLRSFTDVRRAARAARDPRWAAALGLLLLLVLHMGTFMSVKTALPDIIPFHADPALADLDDFLHGAAPWTITAALIPAAWGTAACVFYFGLWWLLLPASLLATVLLPRLRACRDQFLWTYLVTWPLLGNVVAGTFMSAGPLFYEDVTGDETRFAALVTFLDASLPAAARQAARAMWDAYAAGKASPVGGISAFPSMHLAIATLFVLLARRIHRILAILAGVFCAAILLLSVHLGWHYAVDGYFSIGATVLIWRLVGWSLHRAAAPAGRPAGDRGQPTPAS